MKYKTFKYISESKQLTIVLYDDCRVERELIYYKTNNKEFELKRDLSKLFTIDIINGNFEIDICVYNTPIYLDKKFDKLDKKLSDKFLGFYSNIFYNHYFY